MKRAFRLLSRKIHYWAALLIALPILVVIVSGIFLQMKKEISWIQPATQVGGLTLALSFSDILESVRSVPEAGIQDWDDVDRLDVRPEKGVAKVRGKNRWEVQINTETGEVLQVAFRRSDLIESIHDGSWFADWMKLWIFLPAGCLLFIMWVTGIYMYFTMWWTKCKAKRRHKLEAKVDTES